MRLWNALQEYLFVQSMLESFLVTETDLPFGHASAEVQQVRFETAWRP